MKNTGKIQEKYRENTGKIQGKYRKNTGKIQVKYRKNTGKIQGKYRKNTRKMIKIHFGKLLSLLSCQVTFDAKTCWVDSTDSTLGSLTVQQVGEGRRP